MSRDRILFLGHDASRTGAPTVLLQLIRFLKRTTTLDAQLLLIRGGPLLDEFRRLLPTTVIAGEFHEARGGPRGLLPRRLSRRLARHRLTRALDLDQVRLIFCNTIAAGDAVELVEACAAPMVTHVHELESIIAANRPSFDRTAGRTRHFIAASAEVRTNLIDGHGVAANAVEVVEEFVDSEAAATIDRQAVRARLREQIGAPADAFVIGAVGLPQWRKGHDLFLQVARLLGASVHGRPLHLVWLGLDPALRGSSEIVQDATRMQLTAYVHLLNARPDPLECLAGFDIHLLTSREDPFPLVMLEAAALGVPTICFDGSGGAPGFVNDQAGRVVPYGAIEEMCRAAREMLACPEQLERYGQAARAKVRSCYDVTVQAPKVLQIMERYGAK